MELALKPYLRLRQICLVAPALEPAVDKIESIFGIVECHRDEGVEKYGLENALFAFGDSFVEIVAPIRPGTAAGRFLERTGGKGGYMAIFDCNDPGPRRARAQAMGVRIAHDMDYPGFRGSQLHPADCRATMLEFDHTENGEAVDGAYYPAGPHWQRARRPDRIAGIASVDVQSPDPQGIAQHWSRLMDVPLTRDADGVRQLKFDLGAVRFIPALAGQPERLFAMRVNVPDPDAVLNAASAAGCDIEGGGFVFHGMRVLPVPIVPTVPIVPNIG